MNKRGQFYLIIAFFIVLAFSGITYVYVNANAPGDKIGIYDLGEEVHFEASMLIDNRMNAGIKDNKIAETIRTNLTRPYSLRHPDMIFIQVYGNTTEAYIINSTGEISINPSITGNKVAITLMDIQKEVEIIPERQNLYVLIGTERSGEKFIVVR